MMSLLTVSRPGLLYCAEAPRERRYHGSALGVGVLTATVAKQHLRKHIRRMDTPNPFALPE